MKYSVQVHVESVNPLYEDKHCTLLYLGEQDQDKMWEYSYIIKALEGSFPIIASLETDIKGFGVNNDVPVQRVVDDGNYLYRINRELIKFFAGHGIYPKSDFVEYTPHISLGKEGEWNHADFNNEVLQDMVHLVRPALVGRL